MRYLTPPPAPLSPLNPPLPSPQAFKNSGNVAAVFAAYTAALTGLQADVVPSVVRIESSPNAHEASKSDYNRDFGAFFGVGLGVCGLLAVGIFTPRIVASLKGAAAPAAAAPAAA